MRTGATAPSRPELRRIKCTACDTRPSPSATRSKLLWSTRYTPVASNRKTEAANTGSTVYSPPSRGAIVVSQSHIAAALNPPPTAIMTPISKRSVVLHLIGKAPKSESVP